MKTTVNKKLQEHEAIEFYKLPICDVSTERRNFPGVYCYDGIDPLAGDSEGTTDTDAETHMNSMEDRLNMRKTRVNKIESAGGYTRVYGLKNKKTKRMKV